MTAELNKRKRAPNLTDVERSLLSDLVIKYASRVESKRTDQFSVRQKEEAWGELADEFEGMTSARRDWKQLKHVRRNI